MKKKTLVMYVVALVVLTAVSVLIIGGQEQDKTGDLTWQDASLKPSAGQNNGAGSNPSQQPHQFGDFKGAGFKFTGGSTVSGYNLSEIRRVSHPKLVRLVFQFTEGSAGVPGEAPPAYSAEMIDKKIIIKLTGVEQADVMEKKKDILALSSLIKDINFAKTEGKNSEIVLSLSEQASFQVFDLGAPARIVVVLRPEAAQNQKL